MRLLRSWPAVVPNGRSYVHDDIERLVMHDYDYSILGDVDDDVLLIEWDIAVGMEELQAFAVRAARQPDKPLAAPYRLYCGQSTALPRPEWSAWRYVDADQQRGRTGDVPPGAPTAHLTSFGLTYLPQNLIHGYLAAREQAVDGKRWRFSDISFFAWHFRCVEQEVALDWSARPVHLHYELDEEFWNVTSRRSGP